jgi:hypothetical protein
MNRSISKTILFTLMLGLNWIPVFFCATFYYKGGPFVYPVLLIMLLLLCIGNFFASFSLTQFIALSFCLTASAVIATVVDTDCYTTYISDDAMSYGIGFAATIIATLIVLFCSFAAFLIKQKRLKQ